MSEEMNQEKREPARTAARLRKPLDGADAQALEGVLSLTERERNAAIARAERAEGALVKINAIRNSIIGSQCVNWSEHVYPLVSALDEAGCESEWYHVARANLGTLIERAEKAEARVAELEAEVDQQRGRADRAEAAADVRGGEWCARNRAEGRGPCGACAWCCAQAREEVERLRTVIRTGGAMYRLERARMGVPGVRSDDCDPEFCEHDMAEHPAVERVRELETAVRKLGKCSVCNGDGERWPECPYCSDSTHDHECPGKARCESCDGTGMAAEARKALGEETGR